MAQIMRILLVSMPLAARCGHRNDEACAHERLDANFLARALDNRLKLTDAQGLLSLVKTNRVPVGCAALMRRSARITSPSRSWEVSRPPLRRFTRMRPPLRSIWVHSIAVSSDARRPCRYAIRIASQSRSDQRVFLAAFSSRSSSAAVR